MNAWNDLPTRHGRDIKVKWAGAGPWWEGSVSGREQVGRLVPLPASDLTHQAGRRAVSASVPFNLCIYFEYKEVDISSLPPCLSHWALPLTRLWIDTVGFQHFLVRQASSPSLLCTFQLMILEELLCLSNLWSLGIGILTMKYCLLICSITYSCKYVSANSLVSIWIVART